MSEPPVAVVGASLAGLAAAARLAKAGHRVLLFEATATLGGRWAAPGVLPPVFTLPAPWRDLFRKSGRQFDAELARSGHALVPAPPATHHFGAGVRLTLPTDRGEQWTALTDAWGTAAATRWRDLLDDLDERWQLLRRLGLEDEFVNADLTPRHRKALGLNRTVDRLARSFGQPQAAALIRSTAWRIGSAPARTPEFVAVRLAIERTFGRWQLTRGGRPVPAAELIGLLASRLELRGVELRTGEPVTAIAPGRIDTASGSIRIGATVACVNPWEYLRLTGTTERVLRRRTARTRPAFSPSVNLRVEAFAGDRVAEDVRHHDDGVEVEYRLPGDPGTLVTHGFAARTPSPGFGTRWTSPRTWLRQPPLRPSTPTVVLAGASSRGGNDPWAQLLSGALATYVTHENLTGANIRPTNKALKT